MSKPRSEVKEKEYYKDIYFLYEALGTLKNIDEVKIFIKDILTKSELRMLKRRWHVANLLLKGYDIRQAAVESRTSTQTVTRVKKIIEDGYGGLPLAVNRINAKLKKEHDAYIASKRPRGGSKFVKGWFK